MLARLALLGFGVTALAAPEFDPLSPEGLRLRGVVEETVAQRFRSDVGNLLESGTFNLSVSVELIPRTTDGSTTIVAGASPKPGAAQTLGPRLAEGDPIPLDLVLGLPRLDPGVPEPEEQAYSESGAPIAYARAVVKSIRVTLGIAERYGEERRAELEKWLADRVQRDYGKVAEAKVELIRQAPVKEMVRGFVDQLARLQNLAGFALLGLVMAGTLLLAVSQWIRASVRSSAEQRKMEMEISKMPSFQPPETRVEKTASPFDPASFGMYRDAAREMQEKLSALLGSGPGIDPVIASWAQAGESGRMKIACLIESLGAASVKLKIPQDSREALLETLQKMGEIAPEAKQRTLQAAYWEIVAFLTLGTQDIEKPFSYMEEAAQDSIGNLLLDKNPRSQALVALHMPDGALRKYLKALNADQKRALVEEGARIGKFATSEVKELSAAMKGALAGGALAAVGETSVSSVLPRLLGALSPLEETTTLASLLASGMEGIDSLMSSYPSCAFIGALPDADLAALLALTPADEIAVLLRALPDLAVRITPQLPPITAEIVREELARPDSMPEPDKSRHLGNLRARLAALLSQRQLDLGSLHREGSSGGVTAKAA